LAKLAPTSLVFGVWDSRVTQAKAPRLLAATIRAFNVAKLTRSAQYNPAVEYVEEDLLEETEDKGALEARSQWGYRHVPASATHGGVMARGDIRREVTLQIAALRLLRGTTEDETKKLRAYLMGLALVAFTKPAVGFLRQGCNLVLDGDRKPESKVVFPDGRRELSGLTHDAALMFAKKAAAAFGVGDSKAVKFDTKLAKDETTSDGKKKALKKAKA
jgi:CRISPR-associated protein Csb1